MGVRQPQAERLLEAPEAGRVRKDPPLEPSEGVQPCWHLDFRLLSSGSRRESVYVALSHSVYGDL